MARRVTRPKVIPPMEDIDAGPGDDIESAGPMPPIAPESAMTVQDIEEEALQRMMDEMPSSENSAVNVYRLGPNRSHSFLFSFTPGEFNYPQLLARLRDEYDGGSFRVHGRAGSRLVFNEFVSVEAPKRKPLGEQDIEKLLRERMNANQAPPVDQTAMLAQLIQQGFAQLAQALAPRQTDPAELEERFMHRMLQMKTLFDRPPETKSEGGIDTFLKGLEFGKTIMEGVGEASELDVLRDAVKTVGPALLTAMQQPAAPVPRAPAPASNLMGAPRQAAPAPIQSRPLQAAVGDSMKAMQVFYINRMVNAAKQDSDPYAYATNIVDEFDEAKIREFIGAPDSFAKIVAIVPGAEPYKAWFEEVAKEALAILDNVESDDSLDSDAEGDEDMPAG